MRFVLPSPCLAEVKVKMIVAQWCPALCDPMVCPGNSPGKNTRVGCHSLLQGIFPTQGSNPRLLHYRQILYHQGCLGNKPLLQTSMSQHLVWCAAAGSKLNLVQEQKHICGSIEYLCLFNFTSHNVFKVYPRCSMYQYLIPFSCCSLTKSCLILCNLIDCSMPGSFVLRCLPEFAQILVHRVCDAVPLCVYSTFVYPFICP